MASAEDQDTTAAVPAADRPAQAGLAELLDQPGGPAPPAGTGAPPAPRPAATVRLSEEERGLLDDLFAIVSEHAADSPASERPAVDRERVRDAFVFACEH